MHRRWMMGLGLLATAVVPAACGGGNGGMDRDTTAMGVGMNGEGSPRNGTALLALGDSVFHGTVGGAACTVCHGQQAEGTNMAPDLTDAVWLHGDGSLDSIASIVEHGVSAPKKFPAPMPPMGSASLTEEQIRAVAAYVQALGRGPGGAGRDSATR